MKDPLLLLPRITVHNQEQLAPGFFIMRLSSNILFHQRTFGWTLLLLGLFAIGCEEQNEGMVDSTGTPPVLADGVLLPDTVNIDTLTPSNSLYTVRTSARVTATDEDGDITIVVARVLRINSSNTLIEVPLRDDGTGEDSLAMDSVFSGLLEFQIPRSDAGTYRVEYLANDGNTYLSNLVAAAFFATRANSPPMLDTTSLDAPDTVTLPIGGTLLIPMSIAAQDSDGISDIRSLFFLSPDGGNPLFRFPLKDDGGADPGPPSGDPVAGDGVFSILLPVSDSPTIRGTYRLFFQAEDSFGDTSAAFIHRLTIE